MNGVYKALKVITIGRAEAAIPEGACVVAGASAGKVKKAAGDSVFPILGIANESYSTNDLVAVTQYGECRSICRTGAGISKGSPLEASGNANGGVIEGTTPANTIGYARTAGTDGKEMVIDLIYNQL